MTSDGEKTWQNIVRNNLLNIKIYNFEEDKIYNLSDPGIKLPENGIDRSNINDPNISWFYIIENSTRWNFGKNEMLTEYH